MMSQGREGERERGSEEIFSKIEEEKAFLRKKRRGAE